MNEAIDDIPFPDVLIKTEDDHKTFMTKERVGERYRKPETFALMGWAVTFTIGRFYKHLPIAEMIKRFEEVQSAHIEHEAAVHAAKEAAG